MRAEGTKRKKRYKWLIRITLFMIAIAIGLLILLQFPFAQQQLVLKFNDFLSDQLQTQTNVGKVEIDFFDNLTLRDLYIEDQSSDTLVYVESLSIDIGIFSLLKKEVYIDMIEIENVKLNLKNRSPSNGKDYGWNFDFLFPESNGSSTESSWDIGIRSAMIKTYSLSSIDKESSTDVTIDGGLLSINIDDLNLSEKLIHIADVRTDDTRIEMLTTSSEEYKAAEEGDTSDLFSFPDVVPDIGWNIQANSVSGQRNSFSYIYKSNLEKKRSNQSINYDDLVISSLDYKIENVALVTLLQAEIINISLKEKSGLHLKHLSTDILADKKTIRLTELSLKTPNSQIAADFKLDAISSISEKPLITINADQSLIGIQDAIYLMPNLADYTNLKSTDHIAMAGDISSDIEQIEMQNVSLKISEYLQVKTDYTLLNITDILKAPLRADDVLISASSDGLRKILKGIELPEELSLLEEFKITGSVTGENGNIEFNQVELISESGIKTLITGHINNIENPLSASFDMDVHDLTSPLAPFTDYLSGIDQRWVDSIGYLSYQGDLSRYSDTIVINGITQSSIGSVSTDLSFSSDMGTTDIKAYEGSISSDRLMLRGLVDSTYLQDIAFTTSFKGTADQSDGIEAQIISHVSQLSTSDYTLGNIDIKINLTTDSLQAQMDIDDPILSMKNYATAAVQTNISNIILSTQVDTMDLISLGFSDKLSNLSFKSQVESNSIIVDSLLATMHISDIVMLADSTIILPPFQLDIDQIKSDDKSIKLRSDIVDADINGAYQLTQLPKILLNEFGVLVPLLNLPDNENLNSEVTDLRKPLSVMINTKDVTALCSLLDNEVGLDSSTLKLEILPDVAYPKLQGQLSALRYGDLFISNMDINTTEGMTEDGRGHMFAVDASDIRYGDQNIAAAHSTLALDQDQIGYDILLSQDTSNILLDVDGSFSWKAGTYLNIFHKNIILQNEIWQVPEDNYFSWSPDSININSIQFLNADNKVIVSDKHAPLSSLSDDPVSIIIKGLSLLNLTAPLVTAAEIDGDINGAVDVYFIDKGAKVIGDININQISIDSSAVGDMSLQFSNEESEDKNFGKVRIEGSLSGDENEAILQATYDPITSHIELHQSIKKLSLSQFNPFTTETLVTATGYIDGVIDVEGPIADLIYSADIGISDLSTTPLAMGTLVRIDSERLKVDNRSILFDDFKIKDKRGQLASLNGRVLHENFENARFDATIATDGFEMLNTTAEENASFFGRLILAATGTLRGPLTSPVIELTATTLDSTDISIFPFLETQLQSSNNTIIFTTMDDYLSGASETLVRQEQFPFTMRLSLEVTDDAVLQFIIDPISGDKLICQGNANLNLFLPSSGLTEIYGNYTATSGAYSFSYNNLLRKNFEIVPGSTISFNGDPFKATLDASAKYRTQTSVYELINDQTNLSSAEISIAKKRHPVNITMSFDGELSASEISFEIKMDQSNQLSDLIDEGLNELNQNTQDLNRQVFSLLLLNNFVPAARVTENNGLVQGLGATQALSSMSKIFTDQLNNLSDKYIKGVDLSFNVDSYQLDNPTQQTNDLVTELGLGISKKLLNDRLTVEVNGSVDIDNSDQVNDFTSIAGDFLLEYKLTESGNYLLRVFRRSNINNLTDERNIKNGVGLYIKKAFDDRGN